MVVVVDPQKELGFEQEVQIHCRRSSRWCGSYKRCDFIHDGEIDYWCQLWYYSEIEFLKKNPKSTTAISSDFETKNGKGSELFQVEFLGNYN